MEKDGQNRFFSTTHCLCFFFIIINFNVYALHCFAPNNNSSKIPFLYERYAVKNSILVNKILFILFRFFCRNSEFLFDLIPQATRKNKKNKNMLVLFSILFEIKGKSEKSELNIEIKK